MDFSKFKTSDWLIVGGGGAAFIGGFLSWLKVDTGFGSISGGNAFDFFFTGTVPWILLVASAVITVLLILETIKKDAQPWPLIVLGATGLSAILLLIRLLLNPGIPDGVSRGIGMILTVIGGLVAAAGGFLNFQASGGELSDLTDMDKMKKSFGAGDKAANEMPPPPPAGGTAPPPPPPPAQ